MTKFAITLILLCAIVGIFFGMNSSDPVPVQKLIADGNLEPPPPAPLNLSSTTQTMLLSETDEESLDTILSRMRQNVVITKRFIRKGSVISKSDVHLRSVGFFPVYPCTEIEEAVGGKLTRVDIPKGAIVYLEMF